MMSTTTPTSMVTKPKPRDRPVELSYMTTALATRCGA